MKIERYYEDLSSLHIGTMPNRAYYVPCACEEEASAQQMEASGRVRMLSGEDWKFRFYPNPEEVAEGFFEPGFCTCGFDTIPVPSCWNVLGYERHQYTNVRYPFPYDPPYVPEENPCGAYVKTFQLSKEDTAYHAYLNFEGVDSCFYVWVNGSFAGYSQVSHSTSEFDISEYVKAGENTLAVLVLKWCDGSYLEDQDKLRMSGIFRDTYLILRPKRHIRDFFVHTPVDDSYQNARIQIAFEYQGKPVPTEVTLYDPSGKKLETRPAEDGSVQFEVADAVLWNAEQPRQYTAVIKGGDEVIAQKIGIRRIEIKDAVIYVNGVNVKFKGTNRHDSDPFTGFTISREQLLYDLQMMKAHNINAIRTSHYPNAPWAAQLYSEYGFYTIDEADIETHGTITTYNGGHEQDYFQKFSEDRTFGILCHDPAYAESMLDRNQRLVTRDKNCAAVIMWSMGNESGYGPNLEKTAAWIKSYDPSRLVHYESSLYQMKGYQNDLTNIDVHSRMYAPVDAVDYYFTGEYHREHQKPFIQCEFIHAMGNGPGDIEDYFERIYKYDGFAGGFVWEWCDHSVWMGKTNEGMDKYYYGGDFGEFPHDGNFCMDGLVYPDRTPHTGLLEFKNCARPARASLVSENPFTVSFSNKLDFMNLKDKLYARAEILHNGAVIDTVPIADLDIAPKSEKEFVLGLSLPDTGAVSVRIVYYQRKDELLTAIGHELGFDQIMIREKLELAAAEPAEGSISLSEEAHCYILSGERFRYVLNRHTGLFDSMVKDHTAILEQPMEYNLWRAPTDNDRTVRLDWEAAGYDRPMVRVYSIETENQENQVVVKADFSISAVYIQRIITGSIRWTVDAAGNLNVRIDAERDTNLPFLPRFGLRLLMPECYHRVHYFGYGPYESYVDKRRASYLSMFDASVSDMHEDYIKPQENSSHCGCQYLSVADASGKGLEVTGEGFSFNVSPYTQEELTAKMHNFELEPSGCTVLCLDSRMSGIGSGSCGPQLMEEYQVNEPALELEFNLKFGE